MDNPGNQSGESAGPVEDPPPPAPVQDQSTSESSSQQPPQPRPQPPLSPLTGCYLLIVVGEPHSERHKEIILQKIAKAFLSWDVGECHVSLEKELQVITSQSPEGEEARFGERLIQYATENLVTEILIHPQLNTLHQCLKNLLSSFTKHRHIIHAGYTFAGNGSWILQDGTLSISDLVEALHETEVLRVLKAYENSVSVDIHCAAEGDWTTERFQKEPVSKLCSIRINPSDVMTAGNPAIFAFIDYLSPFLEPANIQHLLQPTDVVGNIRFTHPTLYVFPGGQGDAALFGINGFNMLIDGGFARKACFWDFARHLDRLDAVLLTRLNNSTVSGISAVLQRKKMNHVYPQIGHFFCNLQDRKIALSPDGDKDKDSLIVNLAEEGQEIVANLRHLALKPHPCYRDGNQVDPVNLYHKVGHGKLDMYVISPARDSQAVKEFLAKWSSNDSHLFSNTGRKAPGKAFEFPLQNLVSICALLVWQPANPSDTITRILFPGSTPQHKIFEGLEKLRHLEFLKHPVCSAKSISPSASTVTVSRSVSKTRQVKPADNKLKETKVVSKPQPKTVKAKTPPKDLKTKLDTNKLADEKMELENGVEETLKKLDNRILSKDEQIENIKKEIQIIEQAENEEQKKKIIHRSKYDMRNVKSKVDSRAPSKSIDRKKVPEKKTEGDASPPTTPKKGLTNGTATKAEKAKVVPKTTKAASPSSTPAKSAKEANNRKVVEARVTSRSSSRSMTRKKEETPPPPSITAKTERKPISRRPKAPSSPVKTLAGRSAKAEPETLPKKVKKKPEVDLAAVAAVSQKIVEGLEKGAEIEKTELGGGVKIEMKKLDTEMTENKETDEKAVKDQLGSAQSKEGEEEEEDEEYLIVTKEESTEESVNEKENEEEAQTEGEGEMKKLLREEEESEKRRESRGQDEPQEEGEKVEETEKMEDKEGEDKVEEERVDVGKRVDSPEQKTPEGRESEIQRLMDVDEGIDLKEPASKDHKEGESLPEEKISNTLETSATTAPTLPEDERIEEPMREQEEEIEQPEEVQEIVEEKYIQEETKEEKPQEEEAEPPHSNVPTTIDIEGSPAPLPKKHPRDVVKTPDEVADLPMHEEVDPRMYSSGEFSKDLQKKPDEVKTPEEKKSDFKAMIKGEANFLDEDEPNSKKEPDQVRDAITSKYLNIIDELEKSATESKKEEKEKSKVAEEESDKEQVLEEQESKTDVVKMPEERVRENGDLESPTPFLAGETEDTGKVSGNSTPHDLEREEVKRELSEEPTPLDLEVERKSSEEPGKESGKQPTPQEKAGDLSGKSSPQDKPKEVSRRPTPQQMPEDISLPIDIKRDISGRTSPVETTKQTSGKSTSQDIANEHNQKQITQDVEKEISRESSQPDFERDVSGKSTPLDLLSGKSTPRGFRKDSSGKSTPLELGKNASGRSSPDEPERKSSGKSTPLDIEPLKQELSRKSSPDGVQEVSRKSTPQDFDKEESGKPIESEVEKDASGRSTPQDLAKELSDKSTLLGLKKDTSGKSTPQDLEKEDLENHTPEMLEQISGKSTPVEIEKETSRKSTPLGTDEAIIGKTTPLELEKDISRKSTPVHPEKESSGMSTPRELEVETSAKSVSPDLGDGISEKSPLEVEKGISSKSTPLDFDEQTADKSTPLEIEKDSSGKSTPHELGIKISGKSTPQDREKEISRKCTPVDTEEKISGKSTPVEIEKETSGKSTPLCTDEAILGKSTSRELEKDISRKSTPIHLETETSGKSTPIDLEKKVSGKSTPLEVEDISRKSTPLEMEIIEKSAPSDLREEIHRKSIPYQVEKDTSGKSTPVGAEKEVSGKSTPLSVDKEIYIESTPQDQSGDSVPSSTSQNLEKEESAPYKVEKVTSGKTTPSHSEKDKICEPVRNGEKSSGNSTPVREPSRRTSQDFADGPTLEDGKKGPAGTEVSDKTTDSGSAGSFPGSDSEKEQPKQPSEKEGADISEKIPQSESKKVAVVESSVSDSVSSGPGEKDVSGKSTPFSTDKETSGKTSPPGGTKVTSDSFSLALAEKGTSGTYSLEKEVSEKTSSPSPVDISPLSLDEIKDLRDEATKQREELREIDKSPVAVPHLERVKREGGESSGTSTPDRSHREKSESSLANGVESEEELEKGTLESERQEKESQILDLSSGEEEELKALGEEEDVDSEPEVRKNDLEGGTITLATEIAKGEKEDINNLVKIGGEGMAEEEQDSDKKSGVRRMLVTASSEDGGTETEICLQGGARAVDEEAPKEDIEVEGEFSNLILQARREYNNQRSRKTSCNSSDEVEEVEDAESVAGEEEEEELGALLMQARKELAFVRSKSREMKEGAAERVYQTSKTTTRSETTRMDDNYLITITTILTEEREEQEDGSIKVTTTKETTTSGGKDEGTVVTVSTNFERKAEEKEEESSSQMNSSGEGKKERSREDGEAKTSQEEAVETSRRTSASSIISQEDLVSRKDSAKIEDFRQSSTEMSPLKTTYITSHGDSEALMTSSFYGNLPTEDEMIGREFRRGRGYESFTEIGANGERTERTYFYGGEDEGGKGAKDKSRCVKAYYTEEGQQKDGEQSRIVHRYYVPDIPEEETAVERTHFVQRFYTEEPSQSESPDKFRFVEAMAGEPSGNLDFAKAVDEHISARGESLAKQLQQDIAKYTSEKSKSGTDVDESSSQKKDEEKKDVIGDWGKPLGLPLPPKGMNRTYAFPGQNISTTSSLSTPTDNSDSVSNWGQPMSLPSPAPPANQNGTVETLPGKPATKETPKKEKRVQPKRSISGDNRSSGNNTPNRRSESPVKQVERRTPSTGRTTKPVSNSHVYLDLTYVPHHGNSYYSNVEFFKKVRARYYVFSGTEPSKEVYNALLEAKQTWEDKKLEVTIIPTYDTDVLGYWVAENEEILAKHKIDLSPSASRCTINLQDHETSCSAYRLEF